MEKIVRFLKQHGIEKGDIAIITGSGWSKLEELVEPLVKIPYKEIEGFPESKVKGHKGELIWGKINSKNILIFSGRFHYYEGYSMKEVVLPVDVSHMLGVVYLVVTNAAGGLNPSYEIGTLMLIKDHINLFPENPLRGKREFPSMLDAYDESIRNTILKIAENKKIEIKEGIYVGWQGPSLETKAEYRFLRIIGADAVGMSTVPEVIQAKGYGMKVVGFSAITNMGIGDKVKDITHEEVLQVAESCAFKVKEILKEWIENYI